IKRTPDMYLYEMKAELQELCHVDVSLWTIWTVLHQRGYTRKKVMASQHNEEARTNFEIYMATTYHADQLVFVNEAVCNCNTAK
ncbi:hypothetical protein C8R45DRAFT_836066, partial [Mycena sanguinolenta]